MCLLCDVLMDVMDVCVCVFSVCVVVVCVIVIVMVFGCVGMLVVMFGMLCVYDVKCVFVVDWLILGVLLLVGIYCGVDVSEVVVMVCVVFDVGFMWFDTVSYYGLGLSETRLGEALRMYVKKVVKVYIKVGRVMKLMDEVMESECELVVEWGNVLGNDGCIFLDVSRDVLFVFDYFANGFV